MEETETHIKDLSVNGLAVAQFEPGECLYTPQYKWMMTECVA